MIRKTSASFLSDITFSNKFYSEKNCISANYESGNLKSLSYRYCAEEKKDNYAFICQMEYYAGKLY